MKRLMKIVLCLAILAGIGLPSATHAATSPDKPNPERVSMGTCGNQGSSEWALYWWGFALYFNDCDMDYLISALKSNGGTAGGSGKVWNEFGSQLGIPQSILGILIRLSGVALERAYASCGNNGLIVQHKWWWFSPRLTCGSTPR